MDQLWSRFHLGTIPFHRNCLHISNVLHVEVNIYNSKHISTFTEQLSKDCMAGHLWSQSWYGTVWGFLSVGNYGTVVQGEKFTSSYSAITRSHFSERFLRSLRLNRWPVQMWNAVCLSTEVQCAFISSPVFLDCWLAGHEGNMNPVTQCLLHTLGLSASCVLYTLLSVYVKPCSTSPFATCSSPIVNKRCFVTLRVPEWQEQLKQRLERHLGFTGAILES